MSCGARAPARSSRSRRSSSPSSSCSSCRGSSATSARSSSPTSAIYFIALIGLNILTGYTGQISLGHGAFMAIGGYTTAILVSDQGLKLGGRFGGSPDDFTAT